ncbi:hypothetical protein BC831DRAFT_457026 [Entophlyctis helioformis]|nr:hypothetical protein BC831DRAFT_457026 [Entophlyctis helioformis]
MAACTPVGNLLRVILASLYPLPLAATSPASIGCMPVGNPQRTVSASQCPLPPKPIQIHSVCMHAGWQSATCHFDVAASVAARSVCRDLAPAVILPCLDCQQTAETAAHCFSIATTVSARRDPVLL